jgi:hypothetical protein
MKKIMVILGCIFIHSGCATAPTSNPNHMPAQYVAIFYYSPPSQAAVQQSPATFTVGKVVFEYLGKKTWLHAPQFANMEKAVAEDLPEILTTKGLSVRGPFDSYDLIPYADKKSIDFFLIPVVTPMVLLPEVAESLIKVTVKMRLELREIITRELMWSKILTFTEFEVPVTSVLHMYTFDKGKIVDVAFAPEALENLMAKDMEKQYPRLMETIYTLIDLEEMIIIKKQAQEVKSEKGW